jgi:hypothetical protein
MTAHAETTDSTAVLMEVIDSMDNNEKVMFLHTLKLIAGLKRKDARSRRLNDFKTWIDGYRADKATA